MVGWHHRLNGHEFEQTQGDSEGQGSLVFCSSWRFKTSDTTWRLNNNRDYQGQKQVTHFCAPSTGLGSEQVLREYMMNE